jgi:putative ABC transport system permease protein
VSYGIWIGILGGVIGLISGPLIIPPILFTMQKTIYTLPNWTAALSPSSFIAVALSVLCCGASSYIACRKQLKEVPAATLRPMAPKVKGHSYFEKSKLWHKLGFSAQWNLRDVLRSKIRSSMAVIGVMGCTALLIFGLGLRDAVNGFSNWMYKDLNVYENKINLKEDINVEADDELSKMYNGQWIQEANIEMKAKGVKKSGSLTVLDKGEEILFEDKERNRLSLPDKGVALTYKMAELLKVNIGETVLWRAYGEKNWQEAQIAAIYRTPMGQGISMKKEVYENSKGIFKPTALLTRDKVDGAEKLAVVKSVQDKNKLMDSINDMLESMRMIIAILILAAVILGSVVLYNLGALSFTERIRELATLKVLGFLPKQIRSLLQMQNIWLTFIGIVIGIPAGYGLVGFMLATMPDSTDFIADISINSFFISVLGTFIVSVFVSIVLSRKVKEIDMVSALKSVE